MELVITLLKAFLVGGIICVIGQLLIDYTKLTPAKILVMFVVAGVVLGAVGVYEAVADFGGAGATVPLTGFGYTLARETKKAVDEEGLLGVLSGPLSAASVGTMAAILCGLVASVFARPISISLIMSSFFSKRGLSAVITQRSAILPPISPME